MNKSTPLQKLSNSNSQPYEEKENQLVKDILNEIDSNESQQNMQQNVHQEIHEVEQPMAQQMSPQQMSEQQAIQQQMMEQQMMNQINTNVNNGLVDNILTNFKQPLIVAVISVLISIPQLTATLQKMLSSNAALAKYSLILLLVIKGVIAGGLYFAINKNLN